jgi:uncharacterized protein YjlB
VPVYGPGRWHHPGERPEWSGIATIGRFHDDHEIWFIAGGRAKVLVDGGEHYVQSGDIVLTRAGDPHDVLEVYEDLWGFFTETGHPGGGRSGHLHRSEADAAGHDVAAPPLPADFPGR